jgi:NADH:ubiquinone oxidoreductase subunit 5 (subunit L)/multisubunit Na+/H+ antiporter MnhA subunit
LDPKATLKEFGQYSFATIYESATTWIRQAFQYGDKFVRAMMTLLALGATASLVKYGIRNFSMFPDILDVWVKRLGPALAIVSMVIYPAALISKRIFKLSEHAGDEVVRSHELRFYTTVVLFSLTVFILFAGLKVETLVGSSKPTGAYSIEGHEESSIKIMVTFSLIWLVWAISSGACIFSRLLEWEWRGTNAEGGGLQRAGATGSAST